MPKIKFNPAPTFSATVLIPQAGQPAEELDVVFRHKDADGLDDFMARLQKDAAENPAADSTPFIMEIVDSWGLEVELNEGNLRQFLKSYIPAGPKIVAHYTDALMQGRLGN